MGRINETETELWVSHDLGGAELLRGRFVDYAYDLHAHDTASFALVTEGSIRIRTRGREVVARAGDLYAIDAEEPHAGWPVDSSGFCLRTLHIEAEMLKAAIGAGGPSVALAGPILRDRVLAGQFVEVHRRSEAGAPPLELEERYLAFVTRLLQRHTRSAPHIPDAGREDRAVHLARAFLDERLDRRVRLGDISAAAGLPTFRLLRAFARATGMSPHGYQRQARVRWAAELLRRGEPLGEIATRAGFADQAHFTRTFRRTMGVTPGAYKAAFASAKAFIDIPAAKNGSAV